MPAVGGIHLRGWEQPVATASVGIMTPDKYFAERFNKFITNEWVHLERKVAALEAKVHLVLGMLSVLVGLMVYLVIQI